MYARFGEVGKNSRCAHSLDAFRAGRHFGAAIIAVSPVGAQGVVCTSATIIAINVERVDAGVVVAHWRGDARWWGRRRHGGRWGGCRGKGIFEVEEVDSAPNVADSDDAGRMHVVGPGPFEDFCVAARLRVEIPHLVNVATCSSRGIHNAQT